jgi:glycosyltransferase involved in cell wall biosynthesis
MSAQEIAMNPAMPKVSVLMLAYNHAAFIGEAIESVLRQQSSFPFELLIGEDCSSDDTLAIARRFEREHPGLVRVIASAQNVGMGENFRRIIRAARAPYLAFCEGDDFWQDPLKLQKQVAMIDSDPGLGFVYSDFDRCLEIDGAWHTFPGSVRSSGREPRTGHIFEDLLDRVDIHVSTLLCRAELVRTYVDGALFDPRLRLADVPLFLFLAAHSRAAYLPDSLSTYRHHPQSATNRSRQSQLGVVRDHVAVVHRFEDEFSSPTDRRRRRLPALDALIAGVAYSAGDLRVFARHAEWGSGLNWLRALLMAVRPAHAAYMRRVKETQLDHFRRAAAASMPPSQGLQ